MSTTLTTNVIADVVCSYLNTADMGTVRYPAYLKTTFAFANGAGNLQANTLWADTRTVASATPDPIALSGGALLNAFGETITFAKVKVLYIKASDQNGVDITLTDDFGLFALTGDGLVVKPGGVALIAAPDASGYALGPTASPVTGTVTVTPGAGSATYDIFVVGVAA